QGGRAAARLAAVIAGCSNHPGAVWHVDGHPATLAASGHRAPAGWFCHLGAAVSALCAPVWVRRTGVVDPETLAPVGWSGPLAGRRADRAERLGQFQLRGGGLP